MKTHHFNQHHGQHYHNSTFDDHHDFNQTLNQTLTYYGLQESLQSISIGVLFIMSLVGNSLVLRFIIRRKSLHTSTFILIANNCVIDLAITIFIMPICFTVSILRFWPFGDAACQFFGFMDMTLYTGSLMALAAISVIRYFATVCIRDRNYRQKTANKTAFIMIFICWLYSFAWGSFPLVGWNNYVFYIEKLMCNMNHRDKYHYSTASTICTTLAPGLVVIFCSLRIIIAIRQHSQHNQIHQHRRANGRSRLERKVTLTLFVVFIAYCTCTIPQVAVAAIYKYSEDDNLNQRTNYRNIKIMATIIYLSNCTVNPIIYGICNKNLRGAFHFVTFFDNFFDNDGVSQGPTSAQPVLVQVHSKEISMTSSANRRYLKGNLPNSWIQKKLGNRSRLVTMSPKPVNRTAPAETRNRLSDVSLVSIETVHSVIERRSPLKTKSITKGKWKETACIAAPHPRINQLRSGKII